MVAEPAVGVGEVSLVAQEMAADLLEVTEWDEPVRGEVQDPTASSTEPVLCFLPALLQGEEPDVVWYLTATTYQLAVIAPQSLLHQDPFVSALGGFAS